jgi:hypothetical protein
MTTANQDVTLLVTVYPPYAGLLTETLSALERYWPGHPPLVVGCDCAFPFVGRILADLQSVHTDLVVVMHEDLRICGSVKQDKYCNCLDVVRADPSILSCSLTWEPSDIGRYHFPKIPYIENFQVIPSEWDYVVNFQTRIWRRAPLMKILGELPENTTNMALEPLASKAFRRLYPDGKAVTYAIPNPERPSVFVDSTDKSQWIVPFDNLVHAGKMNPRYDTASSLI